jgi:hypothetical protein
MSRKRIVGRTPAAAAGCCRGGAAVRPALGDVPAARMVPRTDEPALVFDALDPKRALLGEQLSRLKGDDFERVYREHIRHIRKSQDLARTLTLESQGP